MLTEHDRFQLKKMVEAHSVEDNTSKLREMQHSGEIRRCVNYIVEKKKVFKTKAELEAAIAGECGFLLFHYFDIYNLMLKDGDVGLLNKFLDVLQAIEEGRCDQHEGSFLVGENLERNVHRHRSQGDGYGGARKAKGAKVHHVGSVPYRRLSFR